MVELQVHTISKKIIMVTHLCEKIFLVLVTIGPSIPPWMPMWPANVTSIMQPYRWSSSRSVVKLTAGQVLGFDWIPGSSYFRLT